MTTDKARKRAVRSRMQKTGERYAAARRNVVRADEPAELPPRVAEPGMSEASIVKGTGHGWDHWLRGDRCLGRHRPRPHRRSRGT